MASQRSRITPRCTRRQFCGAGAAATWAALTASGFGCGSDSGGVRYAARDKFGGCPDIQFEATGFFRIEKADRWWLVTPEGNAFLGFGLNHAGYRPLSQSANRDFWLEQFGAESQEDEAYMAGFREKVRGDMDAFGFNHLGTHSSMRYYEPGFSPYVARSVFVDIPHWKEPTEKEFLDVFSEEFESHCDATARRNAEPIRDDPYVLGYSMTDCPIFTDEDAAERESNVYGAKRKGLPTWPRVLRNLPAESSGKKAYVACVRELYRDDMSGFNSSYGTNFGSFDALANAVDWRPEADPGNAGETRDNSEFLKRVVDRYYQVTSGAIRKYDPNHMILGNKINGNVPTPDFIIALADEYMDLIFYQTFGYYDEQQEHLDRWAKITGKPFFSGDSSYSVPGEGMPDPYGPHCKDQRERARVSIEFAEKAFSRPDFVGWSHCGWMDSSTELPGQAIKQHSGLQNIRGEYHEPILKAFSDFSRRMYDVAAGVSA